MRLPACLALQLALQLALWALAAALVVYESTPEDERQLRAIIHSAVDEALQQRLPSLSCSDNIRKRQISSTSLQSVADDISLQLQDTKDDVMEELKATKDQIMKELKDTRVALQETMTEMADGARQTGQQCTCVSHLQRLELAVQQQYDTLLKSVVDVAEISIGTQQAVQRQLGNVSAALVELGRSSGRSPAADVPDMRLALLTDSLQRFANSSRRQLERIATSQQRSAALLHVVANRTRAHVAPLPCSGPARDCADLRRQGFTESGLYVVRPELGRARLVSVYCDMATAGGGWTVLQRRADLPRHEDFFRGWDDYRRGFGNHSAEFWLGNELIHQLTRDRPVTLRFDMADLEGERRYAQYAAFSVGAEHEQYRLSVGQYTGTAGDGLSRASGVGFTTRDVDNDQYPSGNCAELYKGGWWYDACHNANPNGLYLRGQHGSYADGVNWRFWRGYHYSLAAMEIKLRPSSFRVP